MQVTIYIPPGLYKRLKTVKLSRTVSGICQDALARAVDAATGKRSARKVKKGGLNAQR